MTARSQELRRTLRECIEAGLSNKEAAAKLGISPASASNYARRLGLKFQSRHPWSGVKATADQRSRMMAAMFQDGATLAEIGAQHGVTRERVRQIIAKHHGIRGGDGGQTIRAQKRREAAARRKDDRYLVKYGCTFARWQTIRDFGAGMRKEGAGFYRQPLGAFSTQRQNAYERGIEWNLTLWQWWTIWQASGKWAERGRGQGYVMCRKGDIGAYAIGNIFIAPARENSSETKNKKSGLPIGVSRSKSGNSFVAHRCIEGRQLYLGVHRTPELAHAAYLVAAHGAAA